MGGGLEGLGEEVLVRVERKVWVSQLEVWPRVATEETWMMIWGVCVLLVWTGMVWRMFLRPGQPQRVSVSGLLLRWLSLLGVLAVRAARTLRKSYCLS